LFSLINANFSYDSAYKASLKYSAKNANPLTYWQLTLARRLYLSRFGQYDPAQIKDDEIEKLSEATRARLSGIELIDFVLTACDLSPGQPGADSQGMKALMVRHCNISDADVLLIDKALPGLSSLAIPLLMASQDDKIGFSAASEKLARFLSALMQTLESPIRAKKERELVSFLLIFGHYLNAFALAEIGEYEKAKQAVTASETYLQMVKQRAPSLNLLPLEIQFALLAARLDMPQEASSRMREILRKSSSGWQPSVAERVGILSTSIEILTIVERGWVDSNAI
jgi:hypothetical protein